MDQKTKAKLLDDIAEYLRGMNDRGVYAVIGDEETPEEARNKLYGLCDENDELADQLNQAAEIIREHA